MKLEIATKQKQKIRLALMGSGGAGKTYSALLLAYGLSGNWQKIAIIDTEECSASLYSHFGPFSTIQINPPFHPSKFRDALDLAQDSKKEVIIIDSLSLEWIGEGGVRDWLGDRTWKDVMHEHRLLLSNITSAECHIICTIRTKQRLARFDTSKRGLLNLVELPLQQEGIEYPFTTVLKLDCDHKAHVVKDRTDVFDGTCPARLTTYHGNLLAQWCDNGAAAIPADLEGKVNACNTYEQLQQLLFEENIQDVNLLQAFTKRRLEILSGATVDTFPNDDQPRPAA